MARNLSAALVAILLPSLALGSVEIKSGAGTTKATVDSAYSALRVSVQPRSQDCYAVTNTTGLVGAALASGGAVFGLRISPTGGKTAYVYKVGIDYTTQVAYTTPLSQIRRLVISRGAGAASSGGTALTTFIAKKDSAGGAASQVDTAQGGDVRIATTGALTVTGITWETGNFAECFLGSTATGTAGGVKTCVWTPGEDHNAHPIELEAGQILGVRAGALFDAAGTWTASINIEWCEY